MASKFDGEEDVLHVLSRDMVLFLYSLTPQIHVHEAAKLYTSPVNFMQALSLSLPNKQIIHYSTLGFPCL